MEFAALVLDIEGTVCPISFVKETLFPYFVAKVPSIVQSSETQSDTIKDLLSQFNIADKDALSAHILGLVAADKKDPILKQLQGYVWAEGYSSGEIKAPVYPDAIGMIKRHPNVYIYSSGSVNAQKLLFGHVAGSDGSSIDINPEIKGYFDINTSGAKIDASSYSSILKDIGMADHPEQVLFLSDNPRELDAAKQVGIVTGLAIRPGNAPVPNESDYVTYTDYSKL